jgi:hypothetical protein|tara:strand:- start:2011 stop:2361 length:351 start_codon:yes stop_codon:yes gene_type:complete
MANFAKLGVDNIVEKIEVVSNDIATTEQAGIDFLNNLHNTNYVWKQTFKDGSIRKNYAGVDYTYDETRDAFIGPKPYASWTLNETTCKWEAPVAEPTDGQRYKWNEETQQWVVDNR